MTHPDLLRLERKYAITAAVYDLLDTPWERRYRRWRPRLLGDLTGRVLEAGVGTGRNLPYYPAGVDLLATDLSERMLAVARRRSRLVSCPVRLERADATSLENVESASFDWYVSTFLYCVLPDALQSRALAEMARVLKPGGRFRLVEILYSKDRRRRWGQRLLAPWVAVLYGARFDRRTEEILQRTPGVEVVSREWLEADTYLLIEGRRIPG